MRKVGILGGMGPEATILLMQKVIAAVTAQDDSDHIPLLVDQNPQVPSRIRFLFEGGGSDPAPVLAEMAQGLARAGVQALAMPCNTAHYFAPAIRSAVDIPFLDMLSLAADQALELAGVGGKIGILASPAVRKVGLFEPLLEARGLTAIWPEDDQSSLGLIRRIKTGDTGPELRAAFAALSAELQGRGAPVQMIACTEFSLIPDAVAPGAQVFDTLDCLVREIVAFAQSA